MQRQLLAALTILCFPIPSIAQTQFDGAWDMIVRFEEGSSAGVMRLSSDGNQIHGTSEPLDENQFFPLTVAGAHDAETVSIDLSFRDEFVGELNGAIKDNTLNGQGMLYGVAVSFSAERSDRKLRAPTTHEYQPTSFELQYESRRDPVLTLVPGDRVKTELLDNEGQDADMDWRAMPGNPLTGPFFVESAMPGDTLVVHLRSVKLNRDTAKMYSKTLNKAAVQSGHVQTPTEGWGRTWRFDENRKTAQIEAPGSAISGLSLDLQPMIGSIGVAPPLNMSLYAGDLWIHGGNIDYPRLGEGTTLHIPVYRAGAYLVLGDGHALQGDGEISGQGLETSMDVEFEIDLIPGDRFPHLWSEDADYIMVHGIDSTLDKALQAATTGMINWLKTNYGLVDSEIAALLSPTIKYDIAVIVNSRPHVVARLPKNILEMVERREVLDDIP
ncbi:MAG: acetamidase/formamidase family protein [Henriciella sp.]|nr:acetamidase/formamidase family protein [Henriciella sp.]